MGKPLRTLPVIDNKQCSSCDVCIDSCPVDCLVLTLLSGQRTGRRYPHLPNPDRCIGCGECARTCPLEAIEMKSGF